MTIKKNILISCGDVSGDIHASALARELRLQEPNIYITALGGGNIEDKVDMFLADTVKSEGFGFNGLLKKYFHFRKILFSKIKPLFDDKKIDLVVLVDFYGFNIHVAKLAKKYNLPVVYYVSPQVWASRKYRIKNIKKYVDEVICIFPFEQKLYADHGVSAKYFGHPLVDIINAYPRADIYSELDIPEDSKLIGIMPGSRKKEITMILPAMLAAIEKLNVTDNIRFILFLADPSFQNIINNILNSSTMKDEIKIVYGSRYDIRERLLFCLTTSGTSTLENAILNIPMIIMYRLPFLSYEIAKRIVKIKFIGMPNILANREIVPEYIQSLDENRISELLQSWLDDENKLIKIKQCLRDLGLEKQGNNVLKNVADECLKKTL